jgi:HK97 family phage major capsid protein
MTAKESGQIEQQKRNEYSAIFQKYQNGTVHLADGREVPDFDFPAGVEAEIESRRKELEELHDQTVKLYRAEQLEENEAELKGLEGTRRRIIGAAPPIIGGYQERPPASGYKSLGARFVESHEYKTRKMQNGKASAAFPDVNFKTLMTTAGTPGMAPDSPRSNIIVGYAERTPVVADLIPQATIDVPIHKWMEEQAPTNNASQIAEGGAKPESTLDWNEVTQGLTKIAHWVEVTEEQLEDIPGLMQLIDVRLTRLLHLQEETQILYGNGSGSNMQGFLTKSGLQTQTFTVNNFDTIAQAIKKVNWTGFARASGVVMNPDNWTTARLIKGATNQDYIAGSPLIDVQPRMFGLPVILTPAITAGTALVGDFMGYSALRQKVGMTVRIADQHASNFVSNIIVVLAEFRELLAIYRGAAFAQATSLT